MSSPTAHNSRRKFLRHASLAAAGLGTAPGLLAADRELTIPRRRHTRPVAANDRLRLGLIGAGGMGVQDTDKALEVPGTELVAVCDLYDGHIARARERWGKDVYTTKDHRELLARADVDAVIIATPDHWHRQISIDALEAGKPAYCEKPMVHSVGEGADVIEAARRSGKVYQVGSQGMSSLGNERARELFREGAIGQLVYVEGYWARNSPIGAWQYPIPADASPETVDWQRFTANTEQRPFDPTRFFRWRNYRDYGTGVSGDLYVHLFSSTHFILDSLGPERVMATGGLRYWKDGREVPDILMGMFDYAEQATHPAFNMSLRVNFVDGTSGSTYLRLVGSEGAMDVEWDNVYLRQNLTSDPMDAFAAGKASSEMVSAEKRKVMLPQASTRFVAEPGYKGAHYDHLETFLTAVREGGTVAEDATFGFRAAAPALLCNDSYFGGQPIAWDPAAMRLVG